MAVKAQRKIAAVSTTIPVPLTRDQALGSTCRLQRTQLQGRLRAGKEGDVPCPCPRTKRYFIQIPKASLSFQLDFYTPLIFLKFQCNIFWVD